MPPQEQAQFAKARSQAPPRQVPASAPPPPETSIAKDKVRRTRNRMHMSSSWPCPRADSARNLAEPARRDPSRRSISRMLTRPDTTPHTSVLIPRQHMHPGQASRKPQFSQRKGINRFQKPVTVSSYYRSSTVLHEHCPYPFYDFLETLRGVARRHFGLSVSH